MNDTDLDRYLSNSLKRLYPPGQHPTDFAERGPALRRAATLTRGFRTKLIASVAVACAVVSLAVGAAYLRTEHRSPSAASSRPGDTTPATAAASWAAACMPPRTYAASTYLGKPIVGKTEQQVLTELRNPHTHLVAARTIVVGRNGSCVPNPVIPTVLTRFLYVAVDGSGIIVAAASNDEEGTATPTR